MNEMFFHYPLQLLFLWMLLLPPSNEQFFRSHIPLNQYVFSTETVSVKDMVRRWQAHNKPTVIVYEDPESLVSGLILSIVPSSELRRRANAYVFQTFCGGEHLSCG